MIKTARPNLKSFSQLLLIRKQVQ